MKTNSSSMTENGKMEESMVNIDFINNTLYLNLFCYFISQIMLIHKYLHFYLSLCYSNTNQDMENSLLEMVVFMKESSRMVR